MVFDFNSLEPKIRQILLAPGTDLSRISAKRVRRQLLDLDASLTAEFLKEHKDDVDAVIASVFEQVSAVHGVNDTNDIESSSLDNHSQSSRKRRYGDDDEAEGGNVDDEETSPPPKKVKKASKNGRELSDAELARKLSNEINSRSTRTGGKTRGGTKAGRAKKSSATIDSDGGSDDGDRSKKSKKKSTGGGAKGGFAKEFTLSEPLSAVLQIEQLSRPQVVKQLWVYIKENDLQNPSNKREILCDPGLKAVFGVDKIDMFKMNKVLSQHLHEIES